MDRQGRPSVSLARPCLTVLWLVQPDKLETWLGKTELKDGGFVPRQLPQIFYRGDQAGLTSFQSYAAQAGGIENSEAVLANGNLNELMANHAIDSANPASPFISVTTDPAVARQFAGPQGTVYQIQLSPGQAILNTQNPLPESEWLVPHQILPSQIKGALP